MARGFAEAGADVVIASRTESELKAAAEAIGAKTRVAWFVADLSRRDEAVRLAREAQGAFGRVDILVNNAGSNNPQPVEQIRDEDWDRLVELNLGAGMALTRALAPGDARKPLGPDHPHRLDHGLRLDGRPGGLLGHQGGPDGFDPSQRHRTRRPTAITVNCLAPGPFLTDLPAAVFTEEQRAAIAARTVLGRWADPDELVGPALLLASEAGRYITGTTLVVDGGFLARA